MAGPLTLNPPNADRHITNGAIAWLWVVFAFMILSTLGMAAWAFTRPRGARFFHNIALIILATSTIAYFSMASNLGATPISVEFRHAGFSQTRQIWYVRYIQYFINFPLLLIMLQFATGLALSDILTTAFFAWFVVINGLVGALTASSYKWGYFVFAILGLLYIWSSLLGHGPRTQFHAGDGVRTGYVRGSGLLSLGLILYPFAWGMSEGGNVLSPSGEMVWYSILDFTLGPLFLFYFLFGFRNVDYEGFGFWSGKHTDGYGANGSAVSAPSTALAGSSTNNPATTGPSPAPVSGEKPTTTGPVTSLGPTATGPTV